MTNYARDEFDRVPEVTSRQGVHRSEGAPRRPRLWPVLSVGTGALAVGLASFVLLPQLGFDAAAGASSATDAAVSPSAGPSATPSAAATPSGASAADAPPSDAESSDASAAASPSASASDPASVEALASDVDKALPVSVYNGTLTSGLAGRVGATLQADGWTLGQVANWQGAPQQESVIFYSGAESKARAEALGELLNVTTLVESAGFETSVAVVLGPGFQ
ncbi:MAG: hypothetical protein QOH40_1923 [Arthrobacter pascens]|nr:hypothetical protein [Arthrobacter pascens]